MLWLSGRLGLARVGSKTFYFKRSVHFCSDQAEEIVKYVKQAMMDSIDKNTIMDAATKATAKTKVIFDVILILIYKNNNPTSKLTKYQKFMTSLTIEEIMQTLT